MQLAQLERLAGLHKNIIETSAYPNYFELNSHINIIYLNNICCLQFSGFCAVVPGRVPGGGRREPGHRASVHLRRQFCRLARSQIHEQRPGTNGVCYYY